MKALLTLATLLIFTSISEAIYEPGYVQANECGNNVVAPRGRQARSQGFVSRVCRVTLQGSDRREPLYSFEVVTRGQRQTYVYSLESLRPAYDNSNRVHPGRGNDGRLMMAKLRIIGTIENGHFNSLKFIRNPGTFTMIISSNKSSRLFSMSGNLRVMGDRSYSYPVRVDRFQTVFGVLDSIDRNDNDRGDRRNP